MKIEHFAVSSNSEGDSDKFFIDLLDMRRERDFVVSEDLMEQFFGIRREQKIVRYSNDEVSVETFIIDDKRASLDKFTHICLLVKDRESIIEKARELKIEVIKVPRKNMEGYYLFLKDSFDNLYEIKSL
ncbi:MAG: VOC family protein [Promethearchaeota archaeon]